MADVSKIKLPNGTTYNIKDTVSGYTTNTGTITKVQTTAGAHTTINVSSGAATFNVPTTAAHVGAIPTNTNGNTQNLLRPLQLNGLGDVTLDAKINTLRANRLAFLPAEQIIIEKTTDGGSTWTDAGVSDSTKVGLFSETRAGVYIPLLNGVKNINCGLRITITGMKYNVPSGTAETSKYNYWNSDYVITTERYNQLKEMYFWVFSNSDSIGVKVERATGAASTNWITIFDNTNYGLTGWSGNDYIRFSQGVFGGWSNQTGNYWNYRLTFFTRGPGGSTTLSGTNTTSAQSIMEIRGYGDTWWTAGNEYAANDHLYTHDYLKNATFPAKVTATSFSGSLTGDVTGNVSGTASNVTGTVAIANGGTGQTTAANAINALLNGLPTWTADPTDTTYFIRQDTGGSAAYGKVQATTLWNYISEKLPAWSKASTKPSYNFSEIGSTPTTLSGYGITDAKIASGVITLGSNTITPLTSSSTLSAAKLSGAIPSAVTATTQASTDNSTKIATTAYVTTAIANLPEPMLFKGSVGTGGTVTSLPTAAAANEGWTYKVITALSSPAAKVGDTVISNGSEWIVIPSGDEPSGTVTSVAVSNGGGLSVSGSPITSSGTITISHADTSSQASSSNSGRTYIQSLTLDTYGHVTGISTATETVTNTDEKLKVAEVTSATQYYPIVGTGTTAATRQYDTTGFKYKGTTGTTSAVGSAILELGNSTASGTAGNKQGQLIVYGTNAKKATITLAAPSADIALALPTSGGTLALASQIPSVPSATGSSTTGITASTTATKTTLGTAFTIPNVTSAGSASTWAFEDIACDDITSWSAGSGSASISGAVDSSDSTQLNITISHTHTAPTLQYTARTVSSKKSGANGSAPTLGTAFTVPNVTGNTSATVSITDPGHTHSI